MQNLKIKENPQVKSKFAAYPSHIARLLHRLRDLILATATDIEHIHEIEETLKWGEPSYIVKKGSTIRINWQAKTPHQYAMYFNCNTSLVETFKIVFGDQFKYEKNRAIVFDLDDPIPEQALKECIEMALQYHSLKDKPFLGK